MIYFKFYYYLQGDGPPPDPNYRFLADDERDEPKTEVKPSKSLEKSSKKNQDKNTSQSDKVQSALFDFTCVATSSARDTHAMLD
jgi:hypothetical protein